MRRFYSPPESFEGSRVFLDLDQSNHLKRVLRLEEGDSIRVFDGIGNEFHCEIAAFEKERAKLNILEEVAPPAEESPLELDVAVSIIKGDKFELVIQKAVELGVSAFTPLVTERTEVRVKNPGKRLERWKKIIIESSKQCGRAKLMKIFLPEDFVQFVKTANGTRILFAEKGGSKLSEIDAEKKIIAAIGPEGGWEDSEIELARKTGYQIVTLGGRILRAETAAISIAALLQSGHGDLN